MNQLDLALWFTILGVEIVLAVLLIRGRLYKLLPVFSLYLLWTIVSDIGMMIVQRRFQNSFDRVLMYELSLDAALQFGVLMELAWSVLRPLRTALPRWTVLAIGLLILGVGVLVWPLAGFIVQHNAILNGLAQQYRVFLQLEQTFSILRILFFVILAAGSQLLSLSWRDRELQVATGLGLYSLVSLATALIRAQMSIMSHTYHHLDQVVSISYLGSLGYWAVSFVQKEAPRQEFSPQMQTFLLTVSGAARAGRIALQDNNLPGNRRR
ncbi:hypothetical protein [Terracidiphilus sp.]|jgi:hypothetical protein|uniref:hypothetical protein n=1 Tax=Terracidiphilus sp. TaxID=1964191 RepID=UPI003C1B7FF8